MQTNTAPPNGHRPWSHVPLPSLFEETDVPIKPKGNGQYQASHDFKHSSKSGFPLVIWQDNYWWCSSCNESGDALDFWVQIGQAADRAEAEQALVERFGPPGAPERPHLTDLGNAQRLVAAYGDRIRYCFPWGKWLVWTGKQWKVDDEGMVATYAKTITKLLYAEAGELAKKAASEPDEDRRTTLANQAKGLLSWAKTSETRARIDSTLYLAQSEGGIPVLPAHMDTDPWLLNVDNGVLDLKTGKLLAHDPAWLITKLAPVQYNPKAKCPTWLSVLGRSMASNQNLIDFLQRAFGYALTGDVSEQVFFIFWGSGANGKSTIVDCFIKLLGDYSLQATQELLMVKSKDSHPTERADLFNTRFVAAVETASGERLNESFIKELTGGGQVKARRMRENFWTFWPTHKVFLATNHKPIIKGTDYAIWRRPKLVPFNVIIPRQEWDTKLPAKLQGEWPGILAWAVRGCLDWQKSGLSIPDEVQQATEAYRAEMDMLGQFVMDRCAVGPYLSVKCSDLYTAYQEWCDDQGIRHPWTFKTFGLGLQERGFEKSKRTETGYKYLGLDLRGPEDEYTTDPPLNNPDLGGEKAKNAPADPAQPPDDSSSELYFEAQNSPFQGQNDPLEEGAPRSNEQSTVQETDEKMNSQDPDFVLKNEEMNSHEQYSGLNDYTDSYIGLTGNTVHDCSSKHEIAINCSSIITDEAEVLALVERLRGRVEIGLDTETTGLDPHSDRILTVQLSTSEEAHVIDATKVPVTILKPLLEGSPIKVGQNVGFDWQMLYARGLWLEPVFDTMLCDQVIHNRGFPLGLGALAKNYLDVDMPLKKEHQKTFGDGPLTEEKVEYARLDAAILPPLADAMKVQLQKLGLESTMELENRALPAIAWMEYNGVGFDLDEWQALADAAEAEAVQHERRFDEIVDSLVDLNSPKQVLATLKHLGVPVTNTEEQSLVRYKPEFPAVAALLDYREAKKKSGTYGRNWLEFLNSCTHRVHASWRQLGAATGRLSCEKPNLQNVPRIQAYRNCFVARPGHVLGILDLSQLEPRVLAEITRDPKLLEEFLRGGDVYHRLASEIFEVAYAQIDKNSPERNAAKTMFLAIAYGMGPVSLAAKLSEVLGRPVSEAEAERLLDRFFQRFRKVAAWREGQRKLLRRTNEPLLDKDGNQKVDRWGRPRYKQIGMVRTLTSRRRIVTTPNQAINTPIQGSAGDITKQAMAVLSETRDLSGSAYLVNFCHDEFVVEIPDNPESIAAAKKWLTNAAEAGLKSVLKTVPVGISEADVKISPRWEKP